MNTKGDNAVIMAGMRNTNWVSKSAKEDFIDDMVKLAEKHGYEFFSTMLKQESFEFFVTNQVPFYDALLRSKERDQDDIFFIKCFIDNCYYLLMYLNVRGGKIYDDKLTYYCENECCMLGEYEVHEALEYEIFSTNNTTRLPVELQLAVRKVFNAKRAVLAELTSTEFDGKDIMWVHAL